MSKSIVLAEKPSVGRDIAKYNYYVSQMKNITIYFYRLLINDLN